MFDIIFNTYITYIFFKIIDWITTSKKIRILFSNIKTTWYFN